MKNRPVFLSMFTALVAMAIMLPLAADGASTASAEAERRSEPAPIDAIEIINDGGDPAQYIAQITSGQPSGCAPVRIRRGDGPVRERHLHRSDELGPGGPARALHDDLRPDGLDVPLEGVDARRGLLPRGERRGRRLPDLRPCDPAHQTRHPLLRRERVDFVSTNPKCECQMSERPRSTPRVDTQPSQAKPCLSRADGGACGQPLAGAQGSDPGGRRGSSADSLRPLARAGLLRASRRDGTCGLKANTKNRRPFG